MAKFMVTGEMTISVHVEVDAKNAAEARERALDAPVQHFCYQCATGEPGTWVTSGELDGEPKVIEVKRARR